MFLQSLIAFPLSMKKSPLIHVNENAYFWLHQLQEPRACKCEGILKSLYHKGKNVGIK